MSSLKTFSDIPAETEQQDGSERTRDGEDGKLRRAAQMFWHPDGVRDGGVEGGHGARRVAHERPHHHTDHPGEFDLICCPCGYASKNSKRNCYTDADVIWSDLSRSLSRVNVTP